MWSWIVMHRKYFAGLADQLPYNVAFIELEEGPLMISNVEGSNNSIQIGMRVEVFFEDLSDNFAIPRFRAVPSESGIA